MSKHDDVYTSLLEKLASGEFQVGQEFPSIAKVAAMFKVSTGTAGRALRRLQYRGLISIKQGYHNTVLALPPSEELDLLDELHSIRATINRLIEHLEDPPQPSGVN